jgi:hypothetical protein
MRASFTSTSFHSVNGAAAVKDGEATFAESGLKSRPELREIDLTKLQQIS